MYHVLNDFNHLQMSCYFPFPQIPGLFVWFHPVSGNDKQFIDPNAVGAPLGESLWKLPNRRFHPEYYTMIKKPISMGQIRNKLKKGLYSNVTDMSADLYVMLDNAKKANPPGSKIYRVRNHDRFFFG